MSVKKWTDHALLLSFLLMAFLLLKEHIPFTALVLFCFYLRKRTKDRSFLLFLLLCIIVSIPRMPSSIPKMTEGKAVIAARKYAVLENKKERVLVYTDEPLVFDAVYQIDGEIKPFEHQYGFYRFDSQRWQKQLRFAGTADKEDISFLRSTPSFRSYLQKKIEHSENKAFLYKVLLNINMDDTDSFFFANGFSFAGILSALDILMKYRIRKETRKKVMLMVNAFLCIVYHFPLVLVSSLLFRLLAYTKLPKGNRIGTGLILTLCIYPEYLLSASYLIPAVYRLSFLFQKERKSGCFFFVMCIQSLLFAVMNPLQSLLYPFLKNVLGFLWIFSLLSLFVPASAFPVTILEKLYIVMDKAAFNGSMLGGGLIFYLLMVFTLRKRKHFFLHASILLFLFQLTGLFHPFASISFINVGQGDAILIRGPFNRENILVDTGKPSQWKNLQAYLDGEGVRRLSALFITHGDDDHNGSQQEVISKYHPDQVVLTHQQEVCTGKYCFIDLNEIESDDENESSLAEYFNFNGLKILLTGDMTAYAEEQIVRKYPDLKCDVLKLSHHGSKTSSSERFLDALRPETAVISAGSYSLYHHPSPEVIQRLLKRHISYFNTKEEGDIRIIAAGRMNLLLTSSGKWVIFK